MNTSEPFRYIIDVYRNAQTVRNNNKFTTVNELCDQVPALRPEVLKEATDWLFSQGEFAGNKILTEEDKGAILAGVVTLLARIAPLSSSVRILLPANSPWLNSQSVASFNTSGRRAGT